MAEFHAVDNSEKKPLDPRDVGELLATEFKDHYCYDARRGWMVKFDECEWREDEQALYVTRSVSEFVQNLRDDGKVKRYVRNSEFVSNLQPHIAYHGEWDVQPHVIGIPNGYVLDLLTREQRPVHTADRITKTIGVAPCGKTYYDEHPTWYRVLDNICETTREHEWLKRFVGSCLTGDMREHKFLFLQGAGGGGKTTFIETVAYIAGAYARGVEGDALLGTAERHRQWIARLQGARLCIVSELPSGSWQTGTLKSMVSGDTVTANMMRRHSFDFKPSAKFILAGNHKPRIPQSDSGFRRRMVLIPVPAIPEHNRIDFSEQLRIESPSIARWMIDGASKFLTHGLGATPQRWTDATDDYHDSEDAIGEWFASDCERDTAQFTPAKTIVASFNAYANANMKRPTAIYEWLVEHDVPIVKTRASANGKQHTGIYGISINSFGDSYPV